MEASKSQKAETLKQIKTENMPALVVCQGRDTFIPTASRVFSFLLLSKQPFSFGFHGLFCNSLQVLEDVQ